MLAMTQSGNVHGAVWTTAYENSLPNSSFAFVSEDGKTRKLPYKDANGKVDLPHVRNALARLNQTQGIPDDEKMKIKMMLLNSLKNTKGADDSVIRTVHAIQADATTQELPDRVMLLREGEFNTEKYGVIPLTAADLNEMKANFDDGVGMADEGQTGIPIDFAHQSHLNAGAWIKALSVEADDDGKAVLWGTNMEWSKSGREAILNKEYKCISSDFYPQTFGQWVDPESGVSAKNVIVGAGFTNRPMFTGNKPVMASEADADAEGVKTVVYINASEEPKKENKGMEIDKLRVKAKADLSGEEGIFLAVHASELTDEERKTFGLEATATVDPAVKAAADKKAADEAKAKADADAAAVQAAQAAQGSISIQAADWKAMQETVEALKASNEALKANVQGTEKKEVEDEVKKAVARGAVKADRLDHWTKTILAASGEDRKGLIEDLRSLADNPLVGRKFGLVGSGGTAADDIEAEITKKAAEATAAAKAKGEKLDVYAARAQVLAADQTLKERALVAEHTAYSSMSASQSGSTGLVGVNPEVA